MKKEGSEKFYFVRRPRSGDFFFPLTFLSPEKCKIGEKYKCNGIYTKIKSEKKYIETLERFFLIVFLKILLLSLFPIFLYLDVISTLETIT